MQTLKMEKLKEKIKTYLITDCNDLWSVSIKNDAIFCSFAGQKRFSVQYDSDTEEWNISGKEMNLQIIKDVIDIILLFTERGL